jgi:hypothetical protein
MDDPDVEATQASTVPCLRPDTASSLLLLEGRR